MYLVPVLSLSNPCALSRVETWRLVAFGKIGLLPVAVERGMQQNRKEFGVEITSRAICANGGDVLLLCFVEESAHESGRRRRGKLYSCGQREWTSTSTATRIGDRHDK